MGGRIKKERNQIEKISGSIYVTLIICERLRVEDAILQSKYDELMCQWRLVLKQKLQLNQWQLFVCDGIQQKQCIQQSDFIGISEFQDIIVEQCVDHK